jgi:hypothetical protein
MDSIALERKRNDRVLTYQLYSCPISTNGFAGLGDDVAQNHVTSHFPEH